MQFINRRSKISSKKTSQSQFYCKSTDRSGNSVDRVIFKFSVVVVVRSSKMTTADFFQDISLKLKDLQAKTEKCGLNWNLAPPQSILPDQIREQLKLVDDMEKV